MKESLVALLVLLAGSSHAFVPRLSSSQSLRTPSQLYSATKNENELRKELNLRNTLTEDESKYSVQDGANMEGAFTEANRLYGVLDRRLDEAAYLGGADYSIADIAVFPWLRSHENQGVEMSDYPNVKRWFDAINARPAVERGLQVLADRRRSGPMTDEAREAMFGKTQYQRR